MYTIPHYIKEAQVNSVELKFLWDDRKAGDLYTYDSDELVKKLLRLTPRAQIAIGIGIYEWIIWRFHEVTDDMLPFQLADAAWLGISNPFYMHYIELDRFEWIGPIGGPLWCAVTWMVPMVYYKQKGEDELESGLAYLPRLAMHVLPETGAFEKWLDDCVNRLLLFYEAEEDDPFDDLFEEEDHGGPVVTRECLDLRIDYNPGDASNYFKEYLKNIDPTKNPMITDPEHLKDIEEEYRDHGS